MCTYVQDMKFPWSMLLLGQLYTDDTNDDDNDKDNDTQHATDKAWLQRLIGMYTKWAKKLENYDRRVDNIFN